MWDAAGKRYLDAAGGALVVGVGHGDRAVVRAMKAQADTLAYVHGTQFTTEAMEGYAVLRACALASVPAVEVRVLANAVGEPDRTRWRFDDAHDALAAALPRLVEALDADA